MFQTLRQEVRGDRQFVAETTGAPFEKKSQGRFARVACNLCRGKKLKCTGEKEGCQRCLEKGLACFYGPSSPSSSARPDTAGAAGPQAAVTPPATAEHFTGTGGPAQHGSASGTITDPGPCMFDNDAALYEFLHADPDFEPSEPPASDSLFFDTVGLVSPLHGAMSLSDVFAQTQAHSQAVAPEGALVATGLSSTLPNSSDRPTSSSLDCGPPRQKCGCFDLLRIFEAVEIYLVWATRASGPGNKSFRVDEILSCQKEVLDRCDLRLQCREHPLKSWDAMLLICICDKVLASILKVMAAGDAGPAQSPRPPSSSGRKQSFLDPNSSPSSVMEQVLIKR
ncbi:hypothetical protein INS49_006120 [Diaporthe citri]|uniref:uncharacterized protein n=1 Tax=Diaporthe citri TaxID=83186 RepID=UPI001C8141BC|nr:uncharacterized protein INS49_006120 [Diaporthe citri]KAG6364519.1 hypothetical protein INS49_006120 [Diaporthe citri]